MAMPTTADANISRAPILRVYIIGLLAWALVFLVTLRLGAATDLDFDLIAQLRLPRAVLASAVGMGLAVAGAALQALFCNPLCEPYTLGVSSGSALGAVMGSSVGAYFGLHLLASGLTGTAFIGALLFAGVLYAVSLKPGNGSSTLLLAGVMLGFLGSSLVALWMALADANGIQGALLWLLGDLSRARLRSSFVTLSTITGFCFFVWIRWRELDALLIGEEGARAVGVDVPAIRRRMIFMTSLLVGLCVSSAGMIGFVGLVVPHFVRRWIGSLHFHLIPLCGIWGAVALTAADGLSRAVARPYEIPVGVMTALIGAPIFFWVVVRRGERAW